MSIFHHRLRLPFGRKAPGVEQVEANAAPNLHKYSDYDLILEYFRRSKYDPSTSVFVDVGAQIGLWSRAYVRMGWQVIAFEPEEKNFAALTENISNAKGNFDARRKAISDVAAGSVDFYVSGESIGVHSLRRNHKSLSAQNSQSVEVSTLSRELKSVAPSNHIRFIKFDVEGAELPGLRGYDFEPKAPEIIVCEFGIRSREFGYTFRDLAEYGQSKGLSCVISHKRNGSMEVLWLGPYDSPYVEQLPDNAWGDMMFVRPDIEDRFISCLSYFDLPFPCHYRDVEQNRGK